MFPRRVSPCVWVFRLDMIMVVWLAGIVAGAAAGAQAAPASGPEDGITVTGILSTAGNDARLAIIGRAEQMYIVGVGEHVGDAVVLAISATEVTFKRAAGVFALPLSRVVTSSSAGSQAPLTTSKPPALPPPSATDQAAPAPPPAVPEPAPAVPTRTPYPFPLYPNPAVPAYYPPIVGNFPGPIYDGGLPYLSMNGSYGYYWSPYYGLYYNYYYRPYFYPYYGVVRAPVYVWPGWGWGFRRW